MSTHFNQLTPAKAERLALLAEECAETVQIVGKILRHGYRSHNPLRPEKGTNLTMLETELGDIKAVTELMANNGDIDLRVIGGHARAKHRSMKPYLHHQPDLPRTKGEGELP